MPGVFKAEPYRYGAMASDGNAQGMFIRQHCFPDTYDHRDILTGADHDRCVQWDYTHAMGACQRHMNTGDMGIGGWVEKADPEAVFAFFRDILKTDEHYPGVQWTGFRLIGWVNRSNGAPVFHMELFAKHPESETVVYSDADAPNVKRGRFGRRLSVFGYAHD